MRGKNTEAVWVLFWDLNISGANTRLLCSTRWESSIAAHLRGTISMICLCVWLNIACVSISVLSARCRILKWIAESERDNKRADWLTERQTNKQKHASFLTGTSNQVRNVRDCRGTTEWARKAKSKPCWSPCACVGCMPAVGRWRSGAPGTLQRPSGPPAPPQPGGSGRTCCRLDPAASCSRPPEQRCKFRKGVAGLQMLHVQG